ncbi:molybdopterin converting factor subunit 1 [Paraglaciecola sp.]|uniref:molybdopterin converting factor subunit 1 n=1 Tax=Paraglaciecola sp. TaxID=1920173 RepID=UPI003EF0DBA8
MLRVLFFGQLKEVLKTVRLELDVKDIDTKLDTVSHLRQFLQNKDENWLEYLQAGKVLVAVNQELVQEDHPITDSDEVAFFPPVTGG